MTTLFVKVPEILSPVVSVKLSPDGVKAVEEAVNQGKLVSFFRKENSLDPTERLDPLGFEFFDFEAISSSLYKNWDKFIFSRDRDFNHEALYIIKRGLTRDEFLNLAGFPGESEEILRYLGLEKGPGVVSRTARIVRRGEVQSWYERTGIVKGEILEIHEEITEVRDVLGSKAPFQIVIKSHEVYKITLDKAPETESDWAYIKCVKMLNRLKDASGNLH